jgi:hypothetical protein
MDLVVDGSAPAALKLTQIPGIVDAKNVENDYLLVSLVDSDGNPVVASQETIVYLTSSDSSIASVQDSTVIAVGTPYSMVSTHTTNKAGQSTVTATASDLASANLQFKTIGYAGSVSQYALGLYTVPKISADGQEHEAVFVQLQDQTGTPTPAADDIKVTLSSSAINAGQLQSEALIPKGSTFAVAKFTTAATTTEDTKLKVTASSQGFKSVDADIQTTLQPLTVKIINTIPRQGIFGEDNVPIEVEVKSGSILVKGATIEFGGPNADPTYGVTDENGIAQGTYVSKLPGANSIEVKATMPGFKETIAKVSITLSQTVNLIVKATSEGTDGKAGIDIAAKLKIQAPSVAAKDFNISPGSPAKFTNAKWGTYRITAPEDFTNSMGHFTFLQWSDGSTTNPRSFAVIEDGIISAVYKSQFMLTLSSDYGSVSGAKLYNEGETATISIDSTSVSSGLIDRNFAGWSGDIASQSPVTLVKMNGPKVIKADWQESYLKLALIGAAIGGGGLVAYLKVLKPRRQAIEKTKAPDLDWYKS